MMKKENSRAGKRGLAIGVICVAVAFIGWALFLVLGSGELADKPIYADLQGIELTHRPDKLPAPIFVSSGMSEGGGVFGFPTDDAQFPNAWIAASIAKSDGSVYAVMPGSSHIRATCNQVKAVLTEATNGKIAEPVRMYLLKNCSP